MANEVNIRGSAGVTPPDGPPTPEGTARSIRRLRALFSRADEVCERLERVVLEGGFDPRTLAVMEEAAEHFEDLGDIGPGTALTLRRLVVWARKGAP